MAHTRHMRVYMRRMRCICRVRGIRRWKQTLPYPKFLGNRQTRSKNFISSKFFFKRCKIYFQSQWALNTKKAWHLETIIQKEEFVFKNIRILNFFDTCTKFPELNWRCQIFQNQKTASTLLWEICLYL